MAAGLGFKTFTTGEVLTAADTNGYLMQGINVFATTAARDAAITSPQEGQFAFTKDTNGLWYYDGAAWVASGATGDIEGVTAGIGISGGGTSGTVTITNSMATAIDAKGDLVAGTGADTFSRLAAGTNGFILQTDSSAGTGLSYVGRRWYTLASGSLSGTEVSLTSLSTAYQTLRLEIYSPQTATGSVPVSIRFNSNSGNVYEGCAITSLGTSVLNYASGSALLPMFGQENCPTSAGTYSMFIEVDVYNDTVRKFIRGMWNQTDNVVTGGHCFNSTTAITSVQIRLDGTATFNGGTYVLRGI